MPLSQPVARAKYHTRKIVMDAYAREDGLWDIEGEISDQKTYDISNSARGTVRAAEYIHNMQVRMTVNDQFEVVDVEVAFNANPFPMCSDIAPNFKKLIGLKVGPGWMHRVREQVGGVRGCTHVVEMFGPMATVCFQAIPSGIKQRDGADGRNAERAPKRHGGKPFFLNGCHTWAEDSPVVKQEFPQHYAGN